LDIDFQQIAQTNRFSILELFIDDNSARWQDKTGQVFISDNLQQQLTRLQQLTLQFYDFRGTDYAKWLISIGGVEENRV
jgi:hypothetical protein